MHVTWPVWTLDWHFRGVHKNSADLFFFSLVLHKTRFFLIWHEWWIQWPSIECILGRLSERKATSWLRQKGKKRLFLVTSETNQPPQQVPRLPSCPEFGALTFAVSQTAVVAHGAEVLEYKHGHGWHQQQHHKHHHPHVSAERLCGVGREGVRQERETDGGGIMVKLEGGKREEEFYVSAGGREKDKMKQEKVRDANVEHRIEKRNGVGVGDGRGQKHKEWKERKWAVCHIIWHFIASPWSAKELQVFPTWWVHFGVKI